MERKYFELAKQAYNRKDTVVDGITYSSEEKNTALRDAFKELIPDGKNRYKSFRRNQNEIFELIEETVDDVMPKRVDDAYGGFVEYQGLAQGQKPKFKTKKGRRGLLNFITKVGLGGVIERTRLDVGYITMNMEAYGGAVYVEFERFLDGVVDFTDLTNAIIDGILEKINIQIQTVLKAEYANLATTMKVTANAFISTDMTTLIQNTFSYGDRVVIFCTPVFAGTIMESEGFISDRDKDDLREYGHVGKYRGADIVVLPNAFSDETNASKVLDDEYAFIIPTNEEKIVKCAFEGETIVKETENSDDSLEFKSYKKFGIAIVHNNAFAVYRNVSL
ncbi:MAG: hypothetical protein PHY08_08470 [Candidatus Cloacimonetes bacterium]|nr:hypothetical protein [Candidatus Cloacimonadota bacterium]